MSEIRHHNATVVECFREKRGGNIYLLKLKIEGEKVFEAGPGQFVVLTPMSERSVMPRPFSIVDVEENVVSILIKAVGKNTKAYACLKPGEKINVTGPQGSLIPIKKKDVDYILVVGGIGVAALLFFAKKLREEKKAVTVLLGAKNYNELSGEFYLEKIRCNFESISEMDFCANPYRKGLVTDLLEESLERKGKKTVVITCGPKPMLKKVAEICKHYGIECLVILEEVMACGVGSCKGCAISCVDGSVKHVCSDGPVFKAKEIDWEKLIPKINRKKPCKTLSKKAMNVVLEGRNGATLKLDYPTMNSSGCLGIEALEKGRFDYSKLGALVTKGVTVEPRNGNEMPRTCETPSGMLNSIGLENIGLDKFVKKELPRWKKMGKPVIVNISGFSIEDYAKLAIKIVLAGIDAIEVNISCPNVEEKGGMVFGTNPEYAAEVTEAVRFAAPRAFVIVKLTPNVTDIAGIARAVTDAGADAISLVNTVLGMAIDVHTRMPKIAAVYGGLSGPAIRPIAVRMVNQLYKADLGIPIIGMGGIEDGDSAAEFIMAGANAIAAGTGGFGNRLIFSDIENTLKEIIMRHGFSSIKELTGSMIMR